MKLVVFGANGATGRQVTRLAMDDGHEVTAVVRDPATFAAPHGLRVVRADILDPGAVDRAVSGQDAVVSAVGAAYTRKPVTMYSSGIANIARAMGRDGVRRLVCVSSVCVPPSAAPGERMFFRAAVRPILRTIGRTAYADMVRMEAFLQASDLDWTIIRASGLFDGVDVTDYTIAPTRIPGLFTSRVDLAHALLAAAVRNIHPRAVVDVITAAGTPKFSSLLIKEVSRSR
ncbi:NAD(P)-dependent oxidoreductase [Nocardia sp. NPDC059177]|uniref:NAD(P)-dependent oxidoreductase n=1 Tax=Nocardia sp. NPDC059177 TaxID=3346759 RepID=UPI0036BD9C78